MLDLPGHHEESLASLLTTVGARYGDRTFLHLLEDAGGETTLNYAELLNVSRDAAAALTAAGARAGDRVVLVLPTGVPFIAAFFGAILAGCAVVPVYPPARKKGLADYQEKLSRQLAVAKPSVIVALPAVKLVVEAAAFQARVPARVLEPDALNGRGEGWEGPEPSPDALAVVQFSSGSTGHPKGVMLSQRNLMANLKAICGSLGGGPDDVNCSWLPLYHDMGLIGGLLAPVYCAAPLVLMGPQAFLMDPKRWLWAIHRFRATISTAPNFAYHLLATRLGDAELEGLDLSSWRLALSGAEPVVPETLELFVQRLAPYGFRREALLPVYGLAEVALGAVFPPAGGYRVDRVSAAAVAGEQVARPAQGDEVALSLPAVGRPLEGYAMRIVTEGRELPERQVGEIQLAGPSLMLGYLDDPEATAAALQDGWLCTGDLGYVADGNLYVVGRLKDLILKGGRNYAPQDLEHAASAVEGVRRGCVAAFGVPDPASGTEAVVMVVETRVPAEEHDRLRGAIGTQVFTATGLRPDQVVLVAPGCVPKTSSGKLQRGKTRERWLAGSLASPVEPGLGASAKMFGQAIAQRVTARRGGPDRGQ